jgi:hypothetical protein
MINIPTLTPLLELFTLNDKLMINLSSIEYIIKYYLSCQGFFIGINLNGELPFLLHARQF